MSYRCVAPRIYRHSNGRLYERLTINGRRTFRRLSARTLHEAKRELAKRRSDQALAPEGLARSPYDESANTIGEQVKRYVEDKCPDRRLRPRSGKGRQDERRNAERVANLLGEIRPHQLTHADLRRRLAGQQFRTGSTGKRTLDLQLQALSNAFNYGVAMGLVRENPIRTGRPIYWSEREARPSRSVRPASGDELHAPCSRRRPRSHWDGSACFKR